MLKGHEKAVSAAERRRSIRAATAYFTVLSDRNNRRVLAQGRTANISEEGILLVVRGSGRIPQEGRVCVTIRVPANPALGTTRQVVYRCRIVRRQELGNMLGLGLEFLTKLA